MAEQVSRLLLPQQQRSRSIPPIFFPHTQRPKYNLLIHFGARTHSLGNNVSLLRGLLYFQHLFIHERCSTFQKPSTFPSSTCIHLLQGDSCMLFGLLFMYTYVQQQYFLYAEQRSLATDTKRTNQLRHVIKMPLCQIELDLSVGMGTVTRY